MYNRHIITTNSYKVIKMIFGIVYRSSFTRPERRTSSKLFWNCSKTYNRQIALFKMPTGSGTRRKVAPAAVAEEFSNVYAILCAEFLWGTAETESRMPL